MLTREFPLPNLSLGRLLHTYAGLAENARSVIRNGRWTGGFLPHVSLYP